MADFKAIRLQRRLYVDKTRFLRELENEDYVFLIRSRRFGKTCWLSLLEHYYDRSRADDSTIRRRPCGSASRSTAPRCSTTCSGAIRTCFRRRRGGGFLYAGDHGIPLYVLIDEYENFANTVLAYHGEQAYRTLAHGGGFYHNFFATLKAGTEHRDGALERLFITGVSPIMLDDVTSGFNIATTSVRNRGSTSCSGSPSRRCATC